MTRSRLLVGSVAALLLAAAGCAKEAPEDVESDTVVPVSVAKAETGTITATIRATGIVTPAPGAELIVVAPEAARIAEIPKAEGDAVRRGELLVRFEIPSTQAEASRQQAEITRAEARLTNARAAHARANDLFSRGVAARREVEEAARELADAEADLASARAASTAAEAVAARSVVRATFDGVVARRMHNPGDLVEATGGDAVLRVIDPHRLEIQAAVPVADAPRIVVGASARLVTGADEGRAVALKVVSRPVAVEQGTASVPVRLSFAMPVNYPAGMPVQVEVDAETRSNAVLVPAGALVREGQETALYVVSGDVAHRRVISTGLESREQVQVSKGVESGEAIVVDGQNGLPDGARVSVRR